MKKIFTIILALSALTNVVNAQNFTLNPKNIKAQGSSTKSAIDMNIVINNTSIDATDTFYQYEVLEVNVPATWKVVVCDPEKCIDGSGTVGFKSDFTLMKNVAGSFKIDFEPNGVPGNGSAKVLVRSVKTQSVDTFIAEAKVWNVAVKTVTAQQNKEFSFYPNPAKDELILKYATKENIQVDIYNILGVKVKSVNMSGTQTNVNIEDLQNGIYFIRFKDDGKTVSKTFTKN
ncbi:MAG: T9SS type A sorting domain-containing protein [Bacteroidota bacterium]